MFSKLSATVCSLALVAGLVAATTPTEAVAATPSRITSVKAVPGPRAGQVTISWKADGKNTTGYKIKTGLTSFSSGGSGRSAHAFTVARTRRSVTLSAAQMRSTGAGLGSGNHLYLRVYALSGGTSRAYPHLEVVMPRAAAPSSGGTSIRLASFNVRTARATSDSRNWLRRAPVVARQIKSRNPGVVAMQELGPGRADGKKAKIGNSLRQTTSLTSALRSVGAPKYKLVRTTAYVKPGTTHGTQGARILYDSSRYSVAIRCGETTGKKNYNGSCSMDLPVLSSDGKSKRRSAAYALFQDRRTGKRFWFASVHLDERHSGNLSKERALNALRGRQIAAVHAKLAGLNKQGYEVVIGGDINSWQSNAAGNAPHDYLVNKGFYDTAAAPTRVNTQYPTINHFDTVLRPAGSGYGVRIDVLMVRGAKGTKRFENVVKAVDRARASDHNMIVSDLVL